MVAMSLFHPPVLYMQHNLHFVYSLSDHMKSHLNPVKKIVHFRGVSVGSVSNMKIGL